MASDYLALTFGLMLRQRLQAIANGFTLRHSESCSPAHTTSEAV